MSLVTVATLREYLPEIADNTEIDTQLGNLLDRVEKAVANYLGFPWLDTALSPSLESATYTLYVDSPMVNDPYTLQLPIAPVTAIASIYADASRQYDSSTLIDASTYDLEKALGRVVLNVPIVSRNFSVGKRANKVTLTAGFTAGTLPGDLSHAICVYGSMLHRNKVSQGKESLNTRSGSVRLSKKSMPEEVKEFLNPYRVPGMIL